MLGNFILEGDARLGKNKTEFKSPSQSAFPVCHMPYAVILKTFRPGICEFQLLNKVHDLSDRVAWDKSVLEKHVKFSEENQNKHVENAFYEEIFLKSHFATTREKFFICIFACVRFF